VRQAILVATLAAALPLLAACGGAQQGVDAPGANNNRPDPTWRDPNSSKQDSYTPARDSSATRKTGK
jgi:hypothetical protein